VSGLDENFISDLEVRCRSSSGIAGLDSVFGLQLSGVGVLGEVCLGLLRFFSSCEDRYARVHCDIR